jgi:xylose dehydrogenase (NAD/NADP)
VSAKIRWGILSTALWNKALIGPLQQSARSELAAVASRNLKKAQAYAEEKGIPKAYGSYEELLADSEIDVVFVPLPNALHCEWTVKAAAAGKHVLCEKPLVITMDQMEKIEAAAQANNVTIFEAVGILHHPLTHKVKEIVQAGKLGEIQQITAWRGFCLPPEDRDNIRLKPELGGGSLWDVGVYPNALAILLNQTGPPIEVWACQIKGETGVDLTMSGQMRFSNGVVAQISSSLSTPDRARLHIAGNKGALEVMAPSMPVNTGRTDSQIVISGIDGNTETVVIPARDAYLCEVEAMEACVLDGAAPIVPLSLSRDFLKSILALYQSANSGRPVKL